MFKQQKKHTVDVLFVITLFAVFAISIIVLTGIGATVYQKIVDKMEKNYDSRTAFSYVYNKVKQNDSEGLVSVGEYGGTEALVLSEEIDNITYCTYLYFYDGSIKEVFTRQGQEFDLKYGTDLMEVEAFSISQETDSLLKFEIKPKGGEKEALFVHLRSLE